MIFKARIVFFTVAVITVISFVPAGDLIAQAAKAAPEEEVIALIDEWHRAAAVADGAAFFGFMGPDAIYIGTDSGERWTKDEFVSFAKPYFDDGKAWDFKPYDRDIHFSEDGQYVWFSELLSTWMGVCRGSGVLAKTPEGWRLKQYHLSVTVPNDIIQGFIKLVREYETDKK